MAIILVPITYHFYSKWPFFKENSFLCRYVVKIMMPLWIFHNGIEPLWFFCNGVVPLLIFRKRLELNHIMKCPYKAYKWPSIVSATFYYQFLMNFQKLKCFNSEKIHFWRVGSLWRSVIFYSQLFAISN